MATGKNLCNTRKRPRGFASWNPSGSTLEVLDAVNDVLDEYSANLPLTVRQIFYRLCGRNAIEKTEQGYGRLQEHLVRARVEQASSPLTPSATMAFIGRL